MAGAVVIPFPSPLYRRPSWRERFGFALVNYVPWSPLLIVAGILAIVVVPLTVVGMVVLAVTS